MTASELIGFFTVEHQLAIRIADPQSAGVSAEKVAHNIKAFCADRKRRDRAAFCCIAVELQRSSSPCAPRAKINHPSTARSLARLLQYDIPFAGAREQLFAQNFSGIADRPLCGKRRLLPARSMCPRTKLD